MRDVLVLRAHLAGAGALIGGHLPERRGRARSPSPAGRTCWRHRATASGRRRRGSRSPAPTRSWPATARPRRRGFPELAFAAVRSALDAGRPALVSVPRRGYRPARRLRHLPQRRRAARAAAGPLAQESSPTRSTCRWCAASHQDLACPECGARRWRAVVVGNIRTAEELGRAFPGRHRRAVQRRRRRRPRCRPSRRWSSPPRAPSRSPTRGYGAVLLLDAWALLGRADLRAGEEALRRWMNAVGAGAARRPTGGRVVLVGAAAGLAPVQALVRWDPVGYAEREAASRAELGFPPASRMAALEGAPADIDAFLAEAELPPDADLLGPVPCHAMTSSACWCACRGRRARRSPPRCSRSRGVRSVKKEPVVRVRLDPAADRLSRAAVRKLRRVSVRPIRLLGDPVLRSQAAAGHHVRQRAAAAGQRPHRHHARRARLRAWPRRRSVCRCGCSPTTSTTRSAT